MCAEARKLKGDALGARSASSKRVLFGSGRFGWTPLEGEFGFPGGAVPEIEVDEGLVWDTGLFIQALEVVDG